MRRLLAEQKQELIVAVQERMDYVKDYTDEEVLELIDDVLLEREELRFYPVDVRKDMRKELFNALRRLDVLQSYVDDSSVTEIMVNGTDPIIIEQGGSLKRLDVAFESVERLTDVAAGCDTADCGRLQSCGK